MTMARLKKTGWNSDGALSGQTRSRRAVSVLVQRSESGRFRAIVRIGGEEQPLGSFASESAARKACEGYFAELCRGK